MPFVSSTPTNEQQRFGRGGEGADVCQEGVHIWCACVVAMSPFSSPSALHFIRFTLKMGRQLHLVKSWCMLPA
jgi:hypothetical protein